MSSRPEALLDRYEQLIRRWAPRVDLVAPGDLPRLRERHIDDSLRLLDVLDETPEGPAVDVGSGAGLPGIPLAICGRPRAWRLLEPRAKRAAFLEEVVRALDLDVEVHPLTVAQALELPGWREGHAVAVARALAPPERALEMILPLVGPGGSAAVFVGEAGKFPPDADEWVPGVARMTRMGFEKGKSW